MTVYWPIYEDGLEEQSERQLLKECIPSQAVTRNYKLTNSCVLKICDSISYYSFAVWRYAMTKATCKHLIGLTASEG